MPPMTFSPHILAWLERERGKTEQSQPAKRMKAESRWPELCEGYRRSLKTVIYNNFIILTQGSQMEHIWIAACIFKKYVF